EPDPDPREGPFLAVRQRHGHALGESLGAARCLVDLRHEQIPRGGGGSIGSIPCAGASSATCSASDARRASRQATSGPSCAALVSAESAPARKASLISGRRSGF